MKRRLAVAAVAVVFCAAVGIALFRQKILWEMGAMLVDNEAPEKADIVVVLAGDPAGHRLNKAMDLVRKGYAPRLLLSGPSMIYGVRDSVRAAEYALQHGMSPDQVIPLVRNDASTADEARDIVPELRKLGVRKYLLVTSPSHTGRAARVFRRAAPDLTVRPVAAADPLWCNGYWWTGRECRKTWLLEETKNIADAFRI
jgi:uncharacterized SAM-binding protein YcdF (DUF218 family)